jgi:hypothetical protein
MRLDRLLVWAAAAALAAGCSHESKDPSATPASESANAPPSRVQHSTNGEAIVTVDAATQTVMGLKTTEVQPAQLAPEVTGYGRVLDVSPLASLAAELTTAQAASEASEAELKRLKELAVQSNASQRALQAAEAAAVRDRAQVDSARLRLLANWGQAISERKDLLSFAQRLGSLASALVEIDLPGGEQPRTPPTGARLLTLGQAEAPVSAQFLGPAPVVNSMQGRGYLFLVEPNAVHLVPGSAVTGLLTLPGTPQAGVGLPRDAIVRFNGTTWVYLQTGGETFQRAEVNLVSPLLDGAWFVRDRLKAQDKVVVVGAQELLSEELKGQEME